MLKVKNLTHLTPKKLKKGGNFDHGCKKNRALLDFFCNLVSRFGLILIKISFTQHAAVAVMRHSATMG